MGFILQTQKPPSDTLYEAYQSLRAQIKSPAFDTKLLGYPDPVFDNVFTACELIRQGFPIDEGIEFLPSQVLERAEREAAN